MFQEGHFLNDTYMYAATDVIAYHDSDFQVDVCPYEGGSDHSRFLAQNVPALLTWHFTDYTYHTSVDTLAMSSADEMENVGITTLAAALMMANATDQHEEVAMELVMRMLYAALERMDTETQNTVNHRTYTLSHGGDFEAALANEQEVLNAWGDWYAEAIESVAKYLLKSPSQEYQALEAACLEALALRMEKSLAAAEEFLAEEVTHTGLVELPASEPTFAADGSIACWYCENCGKYFKDAAGTQELSADEVLIPFVAPVAQAGEGGSVTFNEDMTVATITADSGYSIKDVQRNSKSLGAVKTVEGLKSGDVLTVSFEKITAPETGDAMPVVTLLALLALSGGALLALRRRRSF